jgi:VWFA-related protein
MAERPKGVVFLALFCIAGGAASAQPNLVIQTETRVVLVDAVVTGKKGDYIRDLKAKEFRVWEDNKEQTIQSLSFGSTSGGAASAAAEPTYMILFFDNAHLAAGDQVLARQAASSFIDANAGPNRRMAVVSYDGSLRIAQNFTDNAGRLKGALKAMKSTGMPSTSAADTGAGAGARDMLHSLGDLARDLKTFPGRKIVVLLSGELPSSSDQRAEVAAAVEASNKAGVAIYPIDVAPAQLGAGLDGDAPASANGSQTNVAALASVNSMRGMRGDSDPDTQAGGANQPLQIPLRGGGAAPPPASPTRAAVNQQALFALAGGTGGFAILDSGDLMAGLQTIGKEQSEYYVLSYTPPESKEGSCHTLRVKVERSGATVRARSNYCTGKPQDLLAGTVIGKDLETRAAAAQAGGVASPAAAASMQLPYFYVAPNVARVHAVMEIAGDTLKFANQKGKLHAEINLLGIAYTAGGGVAARFSDALKFDFDTQAQVDKLEEEPLHYEKEFKIAPGQYNFTMAFSSGGASFGKLEMPLAVEPRKAGELALSGLMFSTEVHPAAELSPGLDISLIEDRTPLIVHGMQVIPSGSNQFRKSGQAFFYFEVYEAALESSSEIQVRVLDRKTGEPAWDSGPLKLDASQQAGNLPVDSLAPGLYVLEVTAADSRDRKIQRRAEFEIK